MVVVVVVDGGGGGGGGLVSVHVRVYGHTDSEVMHQNVIIFGLYTSKGH